MRLRLILSGLLICALVSLEGAAAIGAGPRRLYKGHTAQRNRIKVAVRGRAVKVLHFKIKLSCRDGSTLIDDESGFQPIGVRGGRFEDVQVGSTDRVFIKGRLRGRRLRGRLRVTDRVGHGIRCHSRSVGFRARRG